MSAPAACPYTVVRDPDTVRDILHRPDDFSPANALLAVTPLSGQALRVLQKARFALPPVLASNPTASHAGIRKVVAGFFTPAKVAAMEHRIHKLAREAAAAAKLHLAAAGQVDLVQAVAANPPAVIMMEMLRLPVRDLAQLKAWSLDSLELFWGWPDPTRQLELARSAAAFYAWLRELVLEAVTAAPEDGAPNLFRALADHGLTIPEICSLGYFLLIAGQETTTQLISTTLFRLLEGSRGMAWEEASSGAKARDIVRHILATESSVPTWRRVAARETELAGKTVSAGDEILMELTGNHGFPWPADGGHPSVSGGTRRAGPTPYGLAFGSGIHRCLGAKLAELEAAIVIQETAAALPGIGLHESAPEWLRLLSFQAPRKVVAHLV